MKSASESGFRSALETFPGRKAPECPTVALVVPIYNEAEQICEVVEGLCSQDYPAITEIWLIDGKSTDGTAEILVDLARDDDRIRLASNARRLPAAALNLAAGLSRCDVVVRLDAHATYRSDVVSRCVAALIATGAGGVGSIARPLPGRTLVERAIVGVHTSPLGLAVASFRKEGSSGWVETIWNGCYWKHVIDETGPWREDLPRAEDNDFNERVRRRGYGLYLCPDVHAFYRARRTLAGLARQYRGNGLGVARALVENPGAVRLRHLAPLALVGGLLLTLLAQPLLPLGPLPFLGALSAYLALVLVATAICSLKQPGWHLALLPVALVVLHLSYAAGEVEGLARQWRRVWAGRRGSHEGGESRGRLSPWRGRSFLCITAQLCALASVLLHPLAPVAAEARPSAWLAPSLERVGREAAPGGQLSLELLAARGEWESFQIVVSGSSQGVKQARVQIGDAVGTAGRRISADNNFKAYRQHYVHVTNPSPAMRGSNQPLGPGWYADALIQHPKDGSFSVEKERNQPLWVDIFVPRDAPAGRYQIEIVVELDTEQLRGEVLLHVWDFILPLVPTLNSAFLVWKADRAIERELLAHRLMPRNVRLQDQKELVKDLGLKSANIGLWSNATNKQCVLGPAPPVEKVRAAAAMHHPGLRLYNYTADEIDNCPKQHETLKAWGRALHAAGVDNLVTMTPTPELYDDGSGSGRSAVDIWVLLPEMHDRASDRVAEVLAKGDEVWSYNALVQDGYSPKWQIDFAPINFRIQPGFISQSLNLTGILYWRVDLWTENPWHDVQTYSTGGRKYFGEGMLFYPGAPAGLQHATPSLRLKWIRDGVEDYEYVAILKRLGCEPTALRLAKSVGASWRDWSREPERLEAARRTLGDTIERFSRGGSCG